MTWRRQDIAENWFGEHQQNRSGEVALEKIVTANPAVIIAMNKRDADAILSSPQWASVDAVIHHRVYVNPECSGGAVKPAKRRCNFVAGENALSCAIC